MTSIPQICATCGNRFIAGRRGQRFCGADCRKADNKFRMREVRKNIRTGAASTPRSTTPTLDVPSVTDAFFADAKLAFLDVAIGVVLTSGVAPGAVLYAIMTVLEADEIEEDAVA